MKKSRMLGNYVGNLAKNKGLSISDLCKTMDCTEEQVRSFLGGHILASFSQISALAKKLEVTVSDLLAGDEEQYNATVVHCMNQFQNADNREFILDIIDDYITIRDSVESV